ncbi:MAG: hypothetical protein ACRDGT_02830 [Candidatus Limnocylindria bacterium]
MRWILATLGIGAAAAGTAAILGQAGSGAQPWTPELRDNFVLAQSIPLALGLGIAAGTFGRGGRALALWAFGLGLFLAIPTGVYEYLGGILDVQPPFDLYLVYRVHYVGAALLLFAVAGLFTGVWMSGDRSFLVPRGQWRGHLRGVAGELPGPLVRPLAGPLGVDLRQPPPPSGRYTFYETVISFPWWGIGIGLITVTGLVKALRYLYPVPGEVLFWASTLHVAAMVILGLKVLDQLRIALAARRRPLLAAGGLLWALGSLAVAFYFVTSAFTAQTAAKEGILAQLALLLGGLAIAGFALLLARQCLSLIVPGRGASG